MFVVLEVDPGGGVHGDDVYGFLDDALETVAELNAEAEADGEPQRYRVFGLRELP